MTEKIKRGQREYDFTLDFDEILIVGCAMFIAIEYMNEQVLLHGQDYMKEDLEKLKVIYNRWDDELNKYVW